MEQVPREADLSNPCFEVLTKKILLKPCHLHIKNDVVALLLLYVHKKNNFLGQF